MNTLTISRASIFDALCATVDEARAKAAGTPWASRVETAWAWLLEQEAFDVVDPYTPHAAVRIPSQSKPGLIYTANGACQCRASEVHNPCWHRAASRLLRNAMDAARAQVRPAEWEAKIAGRSADELIADLY